MSLLLDGTNGETFPSWTTASRPASTAVGQMGYNTTTGGFDAYTAAGWVSVASSATAPVNGPAFYVNQTSSQTISSATSTKIQFQTKVFDTATAFDNTTNYRFTPQVAGYYQINASIGGWGTPTYTQLQLYKNGSQYNLLGIQATASQVNGSSLVYCNGSTDYLEIYIYMTVGQATNGSSTQTWFNGSMVRAA